MSKNKVLNVQGTDIVMISDKNEDYICLTDMVKNYENSHVIIGNWLRRKDTLEYLGIWERLNNPNFNLIEFDEVKKGAGLNRFTLSPKQWIEKTNAIGITSKSGKYGGTFAQKDIAFHFAMWLSPEFQLLIIKEFQLLKERETSGLQQHWDLRRFISKANYHIQTDAIKLNLIPLRNLPKEKEGLVYAEEADVLNVALFGVTSKEWRTNNPQLALHDNNLRDYANTHQLIVMANLQSLNAELIKSKVPQTERVKILRSAAISQLQSLSATPTPETMLVQSPHKKGLPPTTEEKKNDFDKQLTGLLAVPPLKKDKK